MTSQTATLRFYTALQLHREDWSGQLLLHIGLNNHGREFALASLAAGAATLILEPDTRQLREANREGCLTFSVTTLDEALRALKNEVRQGRAITLGLAGNPAHCLNEMVQRGILPTAITASQSPTVAECAALQPLQQWGAKPLHAAGLFAINETSHNIEPHLQALMAEDVATTLQERRSNDEGLRNQFAEGLPTAVQERWLTTAPTLFPRDLSRAYWRNP